MTEGLLARPLLRVNLRYGGCLVKAAVPCDTMVHPNYRRHGLFSRMNELAIETERAKGTALLFNFPIESQVQAISSKGGKSHGSSRPHPHAEPEESGEKRIRRQLA